MGCEDNWVRVAMSDDTLVVDMLLKLNQTEQPLPPLTSFSSDQPVKKVGGGGGQSFGVEWTVRQRRSRQVLRKKSEQTRASPTTPLSWSGATSLSCGAADGVEESSTPVKPLDTARSKVAVTSVTSSVKRSRKKKTLAELKEEESLLMKERRDLRNQLATLRVTLQKQRATNECLKKVKLDLLSRQTPKRETTSVKPGQAQRVTVGSQPTCSIVPMSATCEDIDPSPQVKEVDGGKAFFALPDLNVPVDEDSGPVVLYGTS